MAEQACAKIVSLPIYPTLDRHAIDRIIDATLCCLD